MPHCKNCQTSLDSAYCPTCGQRDVDLERPIWGLIGGVVKETFELDGRAALTVKTLFRYPGLLTSEFLAGRRRTYTSPLRLYLAISISFFIIIAWFAQSGMLLEPGQDPGFDAAVQARFLSDDLPRLMFVMLPMFALLMKIVYLDRLYFDHLIFSLHLHSVAYVILAMVLPLEALAGRHIVHLIMQVVPFVLLPRTFRLRCAPRLSIKMACGRAQVCHRVVRLYDRSVRRDREHEQFHDHRGLADIAKKKGSDPITYRVRNWIRPLATVSLRGIPYR